MNMVIGGACLQSSKQKLNTKSSTKSDIAWVGGVLDQVIWTRYSLKYQGYEICDNVIYQDIQIYIKLENNGRQSSINQTRHINIRYYFITDIITK